MSVSLSQLRKQNPRKKERDMKMKNKGKVHPSPSAPNKDKNKEAILTVFKLLPATILALISVLSLEDREVLAYLITISLKTTTTNTKTAIQDSKKRRPSGTRGFNDDKKKAINHKDSPVFDCDCFDCYTSYWLKWDSSPNRELVHQAIEAFEEHLAMSGEAQQSRKNKRKEKMGKRVGLKPVQVQPEMRVSVQQAAPSPVEGGRVGSSSSDNGAAPVVVVLEKVVDGEEEEVGLVQKKEEAAAEEVVVRSSAAVVAVSSHKGLARTVLPDVLGLLNSRLWSLWSPNV